jgi:hypothetical protein
MKPLHQLGGAAPSVVGFGRRVCSEFENTAHTLSPMPLMHPQK